jgi:hypothetical protein
LWSNPETDVSWNISQKGSRIGLTSGSDEFVDHLQQADSVREDQNYIPLEGFWTVTTWLTLVADFFVLPVGQELSEKLSIQ